MEIGTDKFWHSQKIVQFYDFMENVIERFVPFSVASFIAHCKIRIYKYNSSLFLYFFPCKLRLVTLV